MRFRLTAMALTAAVVAVLGTQGCSRIPRAPAVGSKITLWYAQTDPGAQKIVEDAVGRFETEAAGTAVVTAAIPEDAYVSKLTEAADANAMPDVCHVRDGRALRELVARGRVADITDSEATDNVTGRILPSALRLVTVNNRVFAIPMDASVVVVWYNRALFDKAGATPPATWDDLLAACAKLRAAGVAPIALGIRDMRTPALWYEYLALRIGGVKPFADAVTRTPGAVVAGFAHPSFIEAGRRLQELVRANAFNPAVPPKLQATTPRDLFLTGQAAMILEDTRFLDDVRANAPRMLETIDCIPFPAVAGGAGDPKLVLGGIESAYAVSARTLAPHATLGLIKTLTSDVTETLWGETGRIPSLKADLTAGMMPTATRRAALILQDAPEIQPYYDRVLSPALAELFRSLTQSLLAGTMTPEDAARKMEAQAAAETPAP